MEAKRWPDEQEVHQRQAGWMRRHVTSKSKACTGSRFVNATGISVKVVRLTRGDPGAGACREVSRGRSNRRSGNASEALQGRKAEQRIRDLIWRQWKTPATRFKRLRELGCPRELALIANLRRGPWWCAGTPAVTQHLSPAFFRQNGLLSLCPNMVTCDP